MAVSPSDQMKIGKATRKIIDEAVETATHEMVVTFGRAWYKMAAASIGLGAFVAAGTFLTGRMVFADTFKQTKVVSKTA